MAIVSFFPVTEEMLAVGAIKCGSKERKVFAEKSPSWTCPDCKKSNQEIADEHMVSLSDEATVEAELKAAAEGPLAAHSFSLK